MRIATQAPRSVSTSTVPSLLMKAAVPFCFLSADDCNFHHRSNLSHCFHAHRHASAAKCVHLNSSISAHESGGAILFPLRRRLQLPPSVQPVALLSCASPRKRREVCPPQQFDRGPS